MGQCVSTASVRAQVIVNCLKAHHGGEQHMGNFNPVPDTSGLGTDDLLRMGIAEAQLATVSRNKRERLQHLFTARGLLMEALKRCGQRDPDLCAHLMAVLLKLGEDARVVQSLMTDCKAELPKSPPTKSPPKEHLQPSQEVPQKQPPWLGYVGTGGGGSSSSSCEPHRSPSFAGATPGTAPTATALESSWMTVVQNEQVVAADRDNAPSDPSSESENEEEETPVGGEQQPEFGYDQMAAGLLSGSDEEEEEEEDDDDESCGSSKPSTASPDRSVGTSLSENSAASAAVEALEGVGLVAAGARHCASASSASQPWPPAGGSTGPDGLESAATSTSTASGCTGRVRQQPALSTVQESTDAETEKEAELDKAYDKAAHDRGSSPRPSSPTISVRSANVMGGHPSREASKTTSRERPLEDPLHSSRARVEGRETADIGGGEHDRRDFISEGEKSAHSNPSRSSNPSRGSQSNFAAGTDEPLDVHVQRLSGYLYGREPPKHHRNNSSGASAAELAANPGGGHRRHASSGSSGADQSVVPGTGAFEQHKLEPSSSAPGSSRESPNVQGQHLVPRQGMKQPSQSQGQSSSSSSQGAMSDSDGSAIPTAARSPPFGTPHMLSKSAPLKEERSFKEERGSGGGARFSPRQRELAARLVVSAFRSEDEKSAALTGPPSGLSSSWSKADVTRWLHHMGFGELAPRFTAQDVDGEVLLSLTNDELRGSDFSITLGMAKKLLKYISDLNAQEEKEKKEREKAAAPEPAARSRLSISLANLGTDSIRQLVMGAAPARITITGAPHQEEPPMPVEPQHSEPTSPEPRMRGGFGSQEFRRSASLQMSPSRATLDTLSLVGSAAPSVAPSPFVGAATCRADVTPSRFDLTPTPTAAAPFAAPPTQAHDLISVRVLNGVSGEEEVRFDVKHQASLTEQTFLAMLDRYCQQHAGQALSGLNWLSQSQPGERFERRKCDTDMIREIFSRVNNPKKSSPTVLLLCTVPVRPPSELTATKIRIKNLLPCKVASGTAELVRVQLDTTVLETNHQYTVAFTHQWSNMTYPAQATLLANRRGVELYVPSQIISTGGPQSKDGLYDVHLVVDNAYRSENRRTLTVGSAESELSSSSTRSLSAGSFVPIGRGPSSHT
mmetsp:Transcript_87752/g.283368  ORF Transcript_87752/g.283368 Transcript_87752/m.283368 type:complete len:1130 (-) Transcript_87752:63-3452(-)